MWTVSVSEVSTISGNRKKRGNFAPLLKIFISGQDISSLVRFLTHRYFL